MRSRYRLEIDLINLITKTHPFRQFITSYYYSIQLKYNLVHVKSTFLMNISSNKQFIELFLAQLLELNAPHAPLHLEFVAYSFLHFLPPLQINIISWTILEYLKQIIKLLRRKKLFTDNIPFTAYLKLLGTNIFSRHLSTVPNFVLLSFQLES